MKIVYLTTIDILDKQNSGGAQCCNRNLSLLRQAFGEENVYVCLLTNNIELLKKAGRNTAVFYSELSNRLHYITNALSGRLKDSKKAERDALTYISQLDCDAVFADFSYLGLLQDKLPKKMKQILFMHNIEKIHNKVLRYKRRKYLLFLLPTMLNESKAVKNADVIINLNRRDASLLQRYYGRRSDSIIPITFDDSFTAAKNERTLRSGSKLQLLFVGSLFPPNEHGVIWFVNNIMPHVNAEFTVVGRGFEQLSDVLGKHNVTVIGTVDELSEYYHNADAVVSPILFGDGMKVKTAEALMHGKPMFATDEALEGYEVEGLKNVFRCNTANEFIKAINEYAENLPYTNCDGQIRALFLEKYHTPSYVPILRDLILGCVDAD